MRWRGRDTAFKLYLGTLMIPPIVTMIPNYALMVRLHLLDSYTALIVPAAFSAFGGLDVAVNVWAHDVTGG